MTQSTGFLRAHALGRLLLEENDFSDGLCSFGVTSTSNYDVKYTAPCHAALNRMDLHGDYKFMVDAIYPRGKRLTASMAKRYTKYILKYSPYSEMFAEKNIERGFRRGYYLYNTNVDANILCGGAVLMRMLSESPLIPYMWNRLVEAGTHPDIALLGAHMSGISVDNNIYIIKYTSEGHRAIVPSHFTSESVRDFVLGRHKKYGMYSKRKKYKGFNGMWGEYTGQKNNMGVEVHSLFLKAISEMGADVETRTAIFNHNFNINQGENKELINAEAGLPALASVLNDYYEESINA